MSNKKIPRHTLYYRHIPWVTRGASPIQSPDLPPLRSTLLPDFMFDTESRTGLGRYTTPNYYMCFFNVFTYYCISSQFSTINVQSGFEVICR